MISPDEHLDQAERLADLADRMSLHYGNHDRAVVEIRARARSHRMVGRVLYIGLGAAILGVGWLAAAVVGTLAP